MSGLEFEEKRWMAEHTTWHQAKILAEEGNKSFTRSQDQVVAYNEGRGDERDELRDDINDTLERLAVKQDDSATRTGILLALANVNTLLSEDNAKAA